MARARQRETAMIEPERDYMYEEPRGFFMPLIFGLIIGIGGLAIWLGLPTFGSFIQEQYQGLIVASVPEEYQAYTIWAVIAVGIMLLLLLRGILLRVPLILGVLVGALLWVPFGNHVMAMVPQVEENLPDLRAGLDGLLTDYPTLQSLRDVAESNVAVPSGTPAAEEVAEEATE